MDLLKGCTDLFDLSLKLSVFDDPFRSVHPVRNSATPKDRLQMQSLVQCNMGNGKKKTTTAFLFLGMNIDLEFRIYSTSTKRSKSVLDGIVVCFLFVKMMFTLTFPGFQRFYVGVAIRTMTLLFTRHQGFDP